MKPSSMGRRRPRRRSAGWKPAPHVSALFALIVITLANSASACPVCFGDPNSPMTKGVDNAVYFLLGIVGLVQLGFIALFITFWRRSRALARRREQFRLLEGGLH